MSTVPSAISESMDLPCEVLAISVARRRLGESMAGLSPWFVRDAVTVLSELLMNAMIHGTPDADGRVHAEWATDAEGRLVIAVRDAGGFGVPTLEKPDDADGGGRGLQVIDALSESWSVDSADGTTVRVVISSTGPSQGPGRRPA